MMTRTSPRFTKLFMRLLLAGLVLSLMVFPLSASAFLRSIEGAELLHLNRLTGTNFMEHYAHPEIESYRFTGIYFEPVINRIEDYRIYDQDLRPSHTEELAGEFHAKILQAFSGTDLLVQEPGPRTLVISTYLTNVERFIVEGTGTHLAEAPPDYRTRGGATMEMIWRAGPGGDIVLALRDGRQPEIYDPVGNQDDRFTDIREAFDVWAENLAFFFAVNERVPTN